MFGEMILPARSNSIVSVPGNFFSPNATDCDA